MHHERLRPVEAAGARDAGARVRAVRPLVRVGAGPDLAEPLLRARRDVGRIRRQQVPRLHVRTIYDNLEERLRLGDLFPRFPARRTPSSRCASRVPALHFRVRQQFFLDLETGRLPAYSFIEPRYFDFLRWKANDKHPPHDVRLGEHLIADVYESLRRSPAWDSTLFIRAVRRARRHLRSRAAAGGGES